MLDFFIKSPYLLSLACLPHMKQAEVGTDHQHHVGSVPAGRFSLHGLRRGQRAGKPGFAAHWREKSPRTK